MGAEAKVVEVRDNNDIDREVTQYQATHVFIEALWVVPEKFDVLIPRHPKVKWFVRLHSNVPFIAGEGMAINWIVRYFAVAIKYKQFKVATNSEKMVYDLEHTFGETVVYAPNIYKPGDYANILSTKPPIPNVVDIGGFGAIRTLKDQLIQAMAAVTFAKNLKAQLNFHMNYDRVEIHGEGIFKNIKTLLASTGNRLVIHPWLEHPQFMVLVRQMDLGLQVSFSETFGIVAADFVHANVPVVGSPEITWLNRAYKADPTSMEDIVHHLQNAWKGKKINLQWLNKYGLSCWNNAAEKVWKHLLK
jgi:hypothetical protein